jgi:hypothetical protein
MHVLHWSGARVARMLVTRRWLCTSLDSGHKAMRFNKRNRIVQQPRASWLAWLERIEYMCHVALVVVEGGGQWAMGTTTLYRRSRRHMHVSCLVCLGPRPGG